MGIRVAAVLAAAVLAVAFGAAFLALHKPVGSVPAGDDSKTTAYKAMIMSGYTSLSTAGNFTCSAVGDAGCDGMVAANVPLLTKWAGDLKSFQTPAQFAALDTMLRHHLADAVTYQNALLAAHKSLNDKAFTFAFTAGFYEGEWLDPTVGAIAGSYPRVAGSYHDALALARQHIDACVSQAPGPADLGCEHIYHPEVCTSVGVQACASDADSAAAQVQSFLIGLIQNPAPSALAAKDLQIQTDLAHLDGDIIAITDGLLSGDSGKTVAAEDTYVNDLTIADDAIAGALGA